MEIWRLVWRDHLSPLLSDTALAGLLAALVRKDPALIQSGTTVPPPMSEIVHWKVEGACAIGFCGWCEGLLTVGEVNAYFGQVCRAVDERLGEPAGIRYFLNWYDETPRDVMLVQLSAEVEREIARRLALLEVSL